MQEKEDKKEKETQPSFEAINRYCANLTETGLRMALRQIILYPKDRKHLIKSINEFEKFYGL